MLILNVPVLSGDCFIPFYWLHRDSCANSRNKQKRQKQKVPYSLKEVADAKSKNNNDGQRAKTTERPVK